MLKMFADIGIRRVKIQEILWQHVEPHPPKNGIHDYQWKDLDDLIRWSQAEGYDDIEVVIEASSSWASRSATAMEETIPIAALGEKVGGKILRDLPPKDEEHWQYYHDFVESLVERYDADGVDDMPGLKYSVLKYEVETEAIHHFYRWLSLDDDEYIRLLRTAYEAAKKANPKVHIILTGFWFGDFLHPDEAVEERGRKARAGFGPILAIHAQSTRKLLDEGRDYFDEIEIHALGHYTQNYGLVGWLRKEMKALGYEKPIFFGDAVGTPTFSFGPIELYPTPFSLDHVEMVGVLFDKDHPKFNEVNAWYRAEQSRETVRKGVSAMELGLPRINFAFFSDSPAPKRKLSQKELSTGSLLHNWAIAGYLDRNCKPYPAFYTYKLVIDKLTNAKFVKRLPLEDGAYGFEFASGGDPLYVFWSDKDATVDLTADLQFKTVRVTHIVTEFSQQDPKTEIMDVEDGPFKLDATPNPIFVESGDGAPSN